MAQQTVASQDTQTDRCIVCGASLGRAGAFPVPGGRLAACSACGSWTQFPRPGQTALNAFHNSPEYFAHPYLQLRRENTGGQERRCREIFTRLARFADIDSLRGQPMLDVGCDVGSLLTAAVEKHGVVPFGVDVSEHAVAEARTHGIEAHLGTLETAPESFRGFRLVTGIDLIEHVADPAALLREIRRRLSPDGLVFLETPNLRSTTYRVGYAGSYIGRGHPRALVGRLFPDEHVQYFSAASLARLAQEAGFDTVAIDSRPIPKAELALSASLRTVLNVLQACDRVTGEHTLLCAILRPRRETHS